MKTDIVSDSPIIVMTRMFDAPRAVVWQAFTNPKHVARWFGGHGFTNPVCEMDVRPGGIWKHVMRKPDGSEYAMEYVFVEIVEPEKLVWQDVDFGKRTRQGAIAVMNTITLEEAGAKTKWTLVAKFQSIAERDAAAAFGFATVLAEGCEKFNDVVKELVQ